MYAQSRSTQGGVRVPEHYSGNAFRTDDVPSPPQSGAVPSEMAAMPEHPRVESPALPPSQERAAERPQAQPEAEKADAPAHSDAASHAAGMFPLRLLSGNTLVGAGSEELLLLGLIFLLYSGGSAGREELLLCLVLLLLCGG